MAIEKKEIEYAKEIGDVAKLINHLIATIKAKGDYMAVIPSLIEAVNGVDQVDDEFAVNRKAALATVGYHSGEMIDVLLPEAK